MHKLSTEGVPMGSIDLTPELKKRAEEEVNLDDSNQRIMAKFNKNTDFSPQYECLKMFPLDNSRYSNNPQSRLNSVPSEGDLEKLTKKMSNKKVPYVEILRMHYNYLQAESKQGRL